MSGSARSSRAEALDLGGSGFSADILGVGEGYQQVFVLGVMFHGRQDVIDAQDDMLDPLEVLAGSGVQAQLNLLDGSQDVTVLPPDVLDVQSDGSCGAVSCSRIGTASSVASCASSKKKRPLSAPSQNPSIG